MDDNDHEIFFRVGKFLKKNIEIVLFVFAVIILFGPLYLVYVVFTFRLIRKMVSH